MPRMIIPLSVAICILGTLFAAELGAEDWSRFRGPNGSGVSSETGLPVEFGPDNGVVWATEIPFGRSSPALTADRIFLTAIEGEELMTMALDRASGEMLWKRSLERSRAADLYHATDSSSASPVTDGRNVYAFFHETGIVSYDGSGTERWRYEMGPFRNFYGIAASPILFEGTLYFVADQVEGSYALALDSTTGKEIWKTPRPKRIESYATPILYPDSEAPTELLVLGSSWIDAYDLNTGEADWSLGGVGVGPVASPALAGELLVVSAPDQASEPMTPFAEITGEYDANGDGSLTRDEVTDFWIGAHFGFVDVDGDGTVTATDYAQLEEGMTSDGWGIYGIRLGSEPSILWNTRQSVPYIPSPLIYQGVVYVVKDSVVSSLDPQTGELMKRGRLGQGKAGVSASPVGADGKVYIATTEGQVAVLAAGPQWEPLALNDMGAAIYATPAIADGAIYLRTETHMYRLAAEADQAQDSSE